MDESLPYFRGGRNNAAFFISKFPLQTLMRNANRTEWSPVRSVVIQVLTATENRAVGVRFVYHKYDYRPDWTKQSLIKILLINHKNYNLH